MIIKINDAYSLECEAKNTRNGFKHVAILKWRGNSIETATCHYLNRTWERFIYDTVKSKLLSILDKRKQLSLKDRYMIAKSITIVG